MPRPERLLALALLTLILGGCGRRSDPDRPPVPVPPIQVQIENQNFNDVLVYVETGNQRIRLASVVGQDQASATIPSSLFISGPLTFLAEPIGPREIYRSEPVTISPGDRVLFRIGPQLAFSSVVLR